MATKTIPKSYEFALFRIKENSYNKYISNYTKFLNFISSYRGFEQAGTYQSLSDKLIILDNVTWTTIYDAQTADKEVQQTPTFQELMQPLNEVMFFDNAVITNSYTNNLPYSVLELNIYTINAFNSAEHERAKDEFYNLIIKEAEGLSKIECFKSALSENLYVDTLFWDKLENADKAHKKYSGIDEFEKFKSTIKQMKHFIQMKKLKD